LKDFFEVIYQKRDGLEDLAEKYFQEKRNYEEDIQSLLVACKDSAPKTVKLKISTVKVFLLENGVELSQQFWRRLSGRIKGSRALTLDKVPSNVELRKIMTHLPVQGKALFLSLASSGMRIGEALQLKPEDLDLNSDPVKISIRGEYTKTGNSRIAFISREAKEAIEEWLKVRKNYLGAASARTPSKYHKSTEDLRLFPFTEVNARHMWNIGLSKTGNGKKDTQTNIHEEHPHVLRKFFRTKMATLIPVDVTEALMGHEGYLTEVYRRYSMEDLAKFYKQGESSLLVFTESGEVSKLKMEIEERNKQLQTLVNGFAAENMELKNRMLKTEQKISEIEALIRKALESETEKEG
jgi:integrase